MKNLFIKTLIVLTIVLVASTTYARYCFAERYCFMDGNSLMKWYESYDRLFLHGIDNITDADSIYAAKFMGYYTGVIDATAHLYGFPHRTPLRQLEAITIKYLKAHPEEWNLCGSDLVIKAIKQAYPKKKER